MRICFERLVFEAVGLYTKPLKLQGPKLVIKGPK